MLVIGGSSAPWWLVGELSTSQSTRGSQSGPCQHSVLQDSLARTKVAFLSNQIITITYCVLFLSFYFLNAILTINARISN